MTTRQQHGTTHQQHEEPQRQTDLNAADHPVTATPVDSGYGSPAETTRIEGVKETPPEISGDRSQTQTKAAADDNAMRVGLLNNPSDLRDEWQRVQGTFVDDPQQAVQEASALVDRTLREIHENISRGQIGDSSSTDDLRISFRRYREFFERLLSA